MNRFKLWLLLSVTVLCATFQVSAQTNVKGIDEYNVPKEIELCVKNSAGTEINGEYNPFYLSGDFDGDGKLDFAVQVIRANSKGILICLSNQKTPMLVGAGSSTVWPATQPWRFDAWSIVPKGSIRVSWPKNDAILLDVKEAASGLLYWDGAVLRWKQLTD